MTTIGHRDHRITPLIDPSKPKIMPQILLITQVIKITLLSLDPPNNAIDLPDRLWL
jgi:hypothetical protein